MILGRTYRLKSRGYVGSYSLRCSYPFTTRSMIHAGKGRDREFVLMLLLSLQLLMLLRMMLLMMLLL